MAIAIMTRYFAVFVDYQCQRAWQKKSSKTCDIIYNYQIM